MMIQMPGSSQMVEAVEMEVADVTERWNTIALVNGDTIRMKAVVTRVFAVPGAKDQFGGQQYIVHSQPIMVVMKDLPKGSLDDPPAPGPETPGAAGPGPSTGGPV